MERTLRKNKGFTLIELLLTVAIISVLATIAIPRFSLLVRKSREATTLGRLGTIRAGITIYYGDNGSQYPNELESLAVDKKYISYIPSVWTLEYGAVDNVTNYE